MSSLSQLELDPRPYPTKRSASPTGSHASHSSGYGSILSASEPGTASDEDPASQLPPTGSSRVRNETHGSASDEGAHRPLDISNRGMKMLLKMGWVEGAGLGATSSGRKDPIPTPAQTPLLGLGKATQDAYMLSSVVSKPKELESLVIARETEEGRVKREEKVKLVQTREDEREGRLKTFHCSVCDKGYTTIGQFEEHERSYSHHHAKRALEAKQARKAGKTSADARIEKERKREAKELERMAKAAGVIVQGGPKPSVQGVPSMPSSSSGVSGPSSGSGFKKVGGWAPITTPHHSDGLSAAGCLPLCSQSPSLGQPSLLSKANGLIPVANAAAPNSGFKLVAASAASGNFQALSQARSPTTLGPATSGTNPGLGGESSKPNVDSVPETSSTTSDGQETGGPSSRGLRKNPPGADAPQPTSKFAQVAARLAAQRKADGVAPPKRKPVVQTHEVDTELEQMLEDV